MTIFEHFKSLVQAPDYLANMNQQVFSDAHGKSTRCCHREWRKSNLSYQRAVHLVRIDLAKQVLAQEQFDRERFYFIMGYTTPWGLHHFMKGTFGLTCLEYRWKQHGYPSNKEQARRAQYKVIKQ